MIHQYIDASILDLQYRLHTLKHYAPYHPISNYCTSLVGDCVHYAATGGGTLWAFDPTKL